MISFTLNGLELVVGRWRRPTSPLRAERPERAGLLMWPRGEGRITTQRIQSLTHRESSFHQKKRPSATDGKGREMWVVTLQPGASCGCFH